MTGIVREAGRLKPAIEGSIDVIIADITDRDAIAGVTEKYDYLIHCAAPTKSAYMISNPAEVTDAIVNGTYHILNLAGRCNIRSMVYLSSVEVYGQINCSDGRRATEDEAGYIDVTDIRSCYPLAKLMAENLCHSFYEEYGIPVKIARLAQTFGRGIRMDDTRIFAQIARQIKNGSNILLHTKGNSVGNYCDIDDAVDAILFILHKGENSECYNVVHESNTMTIREMAEMAADEIAEGRIKVCYEISDNKNYGYAADTGIRLSGDKLRKLGWEASADLKEMYRRMLSSIENEGDLGGNKIIGI